jgi:hypothetical protein
MDIDAQRAALSRMAADARARRDWNTYDVLRAALYDLYYFRGGYSFHAANQLTDEMIDFCYAKCDIV